MKWIRIQKDVAAQPDWGTYSDWKGLLRREGQYQCVYCALHESRFGGLRNFHVEHFKPKSRFDELTNDITNLFYSCSVCNCFKGSDWPGDPTARLDTVSYISPSDHDLSDTLLVDDDFQVSGRSRAGEFVVEKLHLNRHQLVMERRDAALTKRLRAAKQVVGEGLRGGRRLPNESLQRIALALDRLTELLIARDDISPYETEDLRQR